jgi:transposase-like protein
MPTEWKPPKTDADVFAQYKGHVEGERELKPKMEEAADRALANGATVGQLARHTGLTPEVFRRRARKLGVEHKRAPTVGKLTQPSKETVPAPEPRPTPAPRRPATAPKREPEPMMEGRLLLEDEAQHFAALARSRANELQGKAFDQATEGASDGIKDYVVVSSALSMGLLTHDEVYGPAGSEETSG